MAIWNEALEWLDRAEQAREVAGQFTDPRARKAVLQVADTFDRLARAAAARKRELVTKSEDRTHDFSRPSLIPTPAPLGRRNRMGQHRGLLTRRNGHGSLSFKTCRSIALSNTGRRRRRGKRNGLENWRLKSTVSSARRRRSRGGRRWVRLRPPPARPTVLIRYPAAAMRKIEAVETVEWLPGGACR